LILLQCLHQRYGFGAFGSEEETRGEEEEVLSSLDFTSIFVSEMSSGHVLALLWRKTNRSEEDGEEAEEDELGRGLVKLKRKLRLEEFGFADDTDAAAR
jgi:hypothetical protein